jgi:hypothetical protein
VTPVRNSGERSTPGPVDAPRAATSPLTAEIAEEDAELRGGFGVSANLCAFLGDLCG